MADISVEADRFAASIEQLMDRLGNAVKRRTPAAVRDSLQKGEQAWKSNARSVLSASYTRGGWGKPGYGKTVKTGRYAESIAHRMRRGGEMPEGEIGSPTMPGLAHLLEKGHAQVGGGSVGPREHIAPAAEEAFAMLEMRLEEEVARAIDEA